MRARSPGTAPRRSSPLRAAALCSLCLAAAARNLAALDVERFRITFAESYEIALARAREMLPLLEERLDGDSYLARVGLAVVFPELVRFSRLRDRAETTMLELSYQMGLNADFSVGLLQMKPSFVEELERATSQKIHARFPSLSFVERDSREIRKARLERLKKTETQIEYLAAFLRLMEIRHPDLRSDPRGSVRTFAAAFNAGLGRSRKELERFYDLELFPFGKSWAGGQYSYCGISLDFYDTFELTSR